MIVVELLGCVSCAVN